MSREVSEKKNQRKKDRLDYDAKDKMIEKKR